jgi:branched-subunit amino acid permease
LIFLIIVNLMINLEKFLVAKVGAFLTPHCLVFAFKISMLAVVLEIIEPIIAPSTFHWLNL